MKFSPLVGKWQGEHIVLTKPLLYAHESGPIKVPKGFTSDLDSVPRIPFAYWLFKGRAGREPAVIHDYLYAVQASRAWADRVFLDAMKDLGVPRRRRWPIYAAVRSAGWAAYRKHGRK